MKTKTINYDEIITKYSEEEFNHGEVTYADYKNRLGIETLTANVDVRLAIEQSDRENFIDELKSLIQKYAR